MIYNFNCNYFRDVTKNLQLLLRKQGTSFQTTAEFEILRILKEKTCYISNNPVKEEKDNFGKYEGYTLPDGNAIKVGNISGKFFFDIFNLARKRAVQSP